MFPWLPFFLARVLPVERASLPKLSRRRPPKKENISFVPSVTVAADPLPGQTFFKPQVPKEDKSVDKKAMVIDQTRNATRSMSLSGFVLERPVGKRGDVNIFNIVQRPLTQG